MDKTARRPIYGLDVIRLFAASVVMIYHFAYKAWATPGNALLIQMKHAPVVPPWYQGSWWGWVGVQIFFVISGAVIAYSSQEIRPATFAKRRLARLLPALLICGTFSLFIVVAIFHVPLMPATVMWLRTITFYPAGPWIMGQFWTLPIEISFYGLVWLLIVTKLVRHLEALAWVLGSVSFTYWMVNSIYAIPGGRLTALLLLQHGCYFAMGILIARIDRSSFRLRHVFLVTVCMIAAAIQIRTTAGWELPDNPDIAAQWITPYVIWVVATALMAGSFIFKAEIARAAQPMDRLLRLLGLMTYPLYLVHIHAGGPVLVQMHLAGFPPVVSIGVSFLAGLLAALIVAVVLEPPLHRYVLAILNGRQPKPKFAG